MTDTGTGREPDGRERGVGWEEGVHGDLVRPTTEKLFRPEGDRIYGSGCDEGPEFQRTDEMVRDEPTRELRVTSSVEEVRRKEPE